MSPGKPITPSAWDGIGCGAFVGVDASHGAPIPHTEVPVVLDWTES